MFNQMLDKAKIVVQAFREKYGVLALFGFAAVLLKLLLFYGLVGVSANFLFVWLVTCGLTALLFSSFQNKWVPAVIYLLFTLLMFADLTYSSFFNRYLSVSLFGMVSVLGDVTDSIKEVVKPQFFLLFLDNVLIFAILWQKKIQGKGAQGAVASVEAVGEETGDEGRIEEANQWDLEIEPLTDLSQLDEFLPSLLEEQIPAETETSLEARLEDLFGEKTGEAEEEQEEEEERQRMTRTQRRLQRKKSSLPNMVLGWASRHKSPLIAVILLLVLVFNITGSFLITSVSNQEIFSYHLKDIVNTLVGKSSYNWTGDTLYPFEDTYQEEKNGPLFGIGEGKNLIVIQVESFQNFVINADYYGQKITPNLNQLLRENTIYFDNYYQQIGTGNTSDAEFATNNSIHGSLASYTYRLFAQNYFRGLPVLLGERGYDTAVYHAHEDRLFWNRENAYSAIGFDTYVGGIGGKAKGQYEMTEWMGWGLTDTEFFQQTMPYLKKLKEPFYSFIITISNHHPYQMLEKYNFIDLRPEDKDSIVGNYINSAAYTDYALGQLFDQLKEEGIYENSVIALYGDHLGLAKNDIHIAKSMKRFLGKNYDFDTALNVPLIITVPGAEEDIRQTVSISGGQMDFLPTIAYLMGIESLDTIYLGHNLLTIDSGFVAEQTHMKKGSFFQDDIVFDMSRDGVFENSRAWNRKTGKSVPLEACYEGYLRSMGLINTSEYILKNDVLKKVFLDGESVVAAFAEQTPIDLPEEMVIAGVPDRRLVGTNSLEALNASYDAGYRNLKVQLCWTEGIEEVKEAVLLKDWDALGQYFETDKAGPLMPKDFWRLKMRDGLTAMNQKDLIEWLKEHPDATVTTEVERSAHYLMKKADEAEPGILDQLVIVFPGTEEYSNVYRGVLDLDVSRNTADQLLKFIQMNAVSAIILSKELAEGAYAKVVEKADCIVFIEDKDTGLITRATDS